MKRKIFQDLHSWKTKSKRKPLILMGARQVGKTFALKKFGEQEYTNTIYLNFENNPRICKLFESRTSGDGNFQPDSFFSVSIFILLLIGLQNCGRRFNIKSFN